MVGRGSGDLLGGGKPLTWEPGGPGSDWCLPLPPFTSLGKSTSHYATHSHSQASASFSRPLIQGLLQAGPWGSFQLSFYLYFQAPCSSAKLAPVMFPMYTLRSPNTVPGLLCCHALPHLTHCKASPLLREDVPDSSRKMAPLPSLNSHGRSCACPLYLVSESAVCFRPSTYSWRTGSVSD